MTTDTQQTLESVVEETFEALAFMFPDGRDEPPPPIESCPTVSVAFTGPFEGELHLAVSPDMFGALAANMLGLEEGESPSENQKVDALKEMANVICGNLLPVISSPREVFDVHEPRIMAKASVTPGESAASMEAWLDSGFVRAWLNRGDACATSNAPRKEEM